MPEVITDNLDLWTSALLTKSTAGRGSNGKLEAYGINKLRELILELAVRGKLVPQDAKDEPASALLKRIQAEKARLIADGKIKKDKPLPRISEEEKPYALPLCWEWVRLPEIYFSISPSGNKLLSSAIKDAGTFPVVDQGQRYIAGYTDEAALLINLPGPVIVFGDHTTERKYIDFDFVAGADGVKILRPILQDEHFFFRQLQGYRLEERGYARHFKVLNDNLYALPPIEEQHRIVAKVDELMALCDQLEQQQADSHAAHQTLVETLLSTLSRVESQQEFSVAWTRIASHFDTLFTTEASIDQLKQTILQLAVLGNLAPQDPNDEAASVALRQCFEQKFLLIEQGNARAEKPLPQIDADEKRWSLPLGWEWERLGNIFSGGSGTTPLRSNSAYFISGTENWFKTTDLNLAVVMEGEEKITKQAVEECNLTYYPPGTVCIAMYGGAGTIGKSGILGVESTINQSVFALPPVEQILPEYLHIFVKTVRDKWMQYAAGLRKDPNINGLIIKKMVMPVPPKAEQHRIVAKVDELMALCDALKARLGEAQTIQIHLADAIVEQAVC